jgi:hypothetical protein
MKRIAQVETVRLSRIKLPTFKTTKSGEQLEVMSSA